MQTIWPHGKDIKCVFLMRISGLQNPSLQEEGKERKEEGKRGRGEGHWGEKQELCKVWGSGSLSGVPGIISASPRYLIEKQILVPILELLNQKLGRWGPEISVLTTPACDSDASLSLRITA